MTNFQRSVLSTLIAAALTACGGGGDSGGSSTVTPSEPQVTSAIATQIVSGEITTAQGSGLAGADVTLRFYDAAGNVLSEQQTSSDAQGFYSVTIPNIEAQEHLAQRLITTVEKQGYVSNEKSLDIGSDSLRLVVDARLVEAQVTTVKRADLEELVVASNGVPTLMFSLVKKQDGDARIVVGDVIPAADEEVQLAINLPVANIEENVEAINSEIAYFDSSNPDDIQSFPGEFEGQGQTDQQGQGVSFERDDDDESYRLISSTFSQIKLTDENQQPLPLSDVQPSNSAAPFLVMAVPKGSYPTIERDFDMSVDGIQIPIYVYRSGEGWQYVGNGLLVNDPAGNTSTSSSDIAIDEQTGEISLTGNESLQLYVKVTITQANKWIQWINLDWPIRTGESTNVCLQGTVRYQEGEPFNGNASLRTPDGGTQWVYIQNGQYQIETPLLGSSDTALDHTQWSIDVFNHKTDRYEQVVMTQRFVAESDSDSATCANTLATLELVDPYTCQVTGNTYESDGETPLGYQFVTIRHPFGVEHAYSDEQGHYTQGVLCDTPLEVSALGATEQVTVTTDQRSADVDFSRGNQPPILGAILSGRDSLLLTQSTSLRWSVSDPDDDEVEVSVSCSEPESCTIEQDEQSADIRFSQVGEHELTVTADDGQHQVSKSFVVSVREGANIAPQLLGIEMNGERYFAGNTLAIQQGQAPLLTAIAQDRNGDALSYVWSEACQSLTETCQLDVLDVGEHVLQLSITDDHSAPQTVDASFTVQVIEDQAPEIRSISVDPAMVGSDGVNNTGAIRLTALFSDDFTANDALVLNWALQDEAQNDVTALLNETQQSLVELPAGSVPIGQYTATFTVTDASEQSSSDSVSFTVQDNMAPTVSLASDYQTAVVTQGARLDQAITVTATVSDDDDIERVALEWQLLRAAEGVDGVELVIDSDNNRATIPAGSLATGSYEVVAVASDQYGLTSEARYRFEIDEDRAPVISALNVSPRTQVANDQQLSSSDITIQAIAEDDLDSELTYQWQFEPAVTATEDGNSATIAAGSLAIGDYQVKVTVSDSRGQSTQSSAAFSVVEDSGNTGIIIE